jgi:hypothetical protein
MCCITSLLLLVAVAPLGAFGDPPTSEIDALVAKLGSTQFKERQAATLALDRRGSDALPALQAALASADPEIRHRAALLVHKIELRVEIAKLLAPRKIRLVYDNVNVLDAVNDLSTKTGLAIEVQGDRQGLRERKVTLETGELPFWEAFDLLCRKAGLRERINVLNAPLANPYANVDHARVRAYKFPDITPASLQIALEDSKAPALPTTYHGALRLQAVPPQVPRGQAIVVRYPPIETPACVGFILEVTPEAKVPWQGIVSLKITKAIDEHDQALLQLQDSSTSVNESNMANEVAAWLDNPTSGLPLRQIAVRLQPGKQPARSLKEVEGVLTVNLTAMRKLVTVDYVLTAATKEFKAGDGTVLKVLEATEQQQTLVIDIQVSNSPGGIPAGSGVTVIKRKNGVLVIDGPGPNRAGQETAFALTDGTGKLSMVPTQVDSTLVENGKGGVDVQYALRFAKPQKADALRLTFSAPRLVTTDIPFTLRDVPLVENPSLPPRNLEILLTR